jgi:CRISPR-associated endoribonuclease Cas6
MNETTEIEIMFEIELKKDIPLNESYYKIGKLVAKSFYYDGSELQKEHYEHKFKPYVFSNMGYVKDRLYKAGKKYRLLLRTVDEKYAKYVKDAEDKNGILRVAGKEKCFFSSEKRIKALMSVNPIVLVKNDKKYFVDEDMSIAINLLNQNAEKKMKTLLGEEIKNLDFIKAIKKINKYPIVMRYKNGVKMIGNKFLIVPKEDELSQKVVKFLYGLGLGNKNASMGAGFFNIGA